MWKVNVQVKMIIFIWLVWKDKTLLGTIYKEGDGMVRRYAHFARRNLKITFTFSTNAHFQLKTSFPNNLYKRTINLTNTRFKTKYTFAQHIYLIQFI